MPPDQWLEVARQIKEAHCYTCSDIAKVRTPKHAFRCHTKPAVCLMSTLPVFARQDMLDPDSDADESEF